MTAWYNEIEPYAAAWLRRLVAAGHVAAGHVEERSVADVRSDELARVVQAHFFAGIGGWSYALRLAGWPDDRPVWTGSCPCQPFSVAGKRGGRVQDWQHLRARNRHLVADARHLWPVWHDIISECRPPVLFGEQVASADGRAWLAAVRADLEALGYRVGAADLCAAGVGAPHIRQRIFWVADADQGQRGRVADGAGRDGDRPAAGRLEGDGFAGSGGVVRIMADAVSAGRAERRPGAGGGSAAGSGGADLVGDTGVSRLAGRAGERGDDGAQRSPAERAGGDADPWSDAAWIPCRDGKARPVEPGLAPLAHGVPARVGKLRAYGNAIVPQVAATFVKAYMEAA